MWRWGQEKVTSSVYSPAHIGDIFHLQHKLDRVGETKRNKTEKKERKKERG